MAEEAYEFNGIISGSDPVHTTEVVITSGQNIKQYAPLGMVSATGKFVAYDPAANNGSQSAVYLSVSAIDAAAGDVSTQVYKAGTFDPDMVEWPAGATDAHKLAAFVGTPISLQKRI